MRAACGCEVDASGIVLHGVDGPCSDEMREPEWTQEDQCHAEGHPYRGDEWPLPDPDDAPTDFAVILAEGGRCYCGARRYPHGGPT